ncbi:potassium-transporting ATPase subunit KdpC [Legionella fallonii]|uniref:Potassium-transporting ATPase KdpC subunit n=1 Tax=Legionella fallonii LLAP-10 TaxID=1212491 RepID=A0A098G7Y8_9GAMM|nr:potassium-transporting ATPase subunit KdpC [Legionella fallonii]CEG58126.1 potassium translocating ATPase, subunit C [Legionella fallonii LLAP-10]
MKRLQLEVKDLKIALRLFFFLTILTGIIYPLVVTGLAQVFFPHQANGSLIKQGDKVVGSRLIGQSFTEAKYFWGRPSATSPFPYNGESSSGSNMGPSNPAFINQIKERAQTFRQFNTNKNLSVPVELVTASGSGLDAEISPWAAFYQIPRIAKARHLQEISLAHLIHQHIQRRTLGILGEPRVNVLQLNLALDELGAQHG